MQLFSLSHTLYTPPPPRLILDTKGVLASGRANNEIDKGSTLQAVRPRLAPPAHSYRTIRIYNYNWQCTNHAQARHGVSEPYRRPSARVTLPRCVCVCVGFALRSKLAIVCGLDWLCLLFILNLVSRHFLKCSKKFWLWQNTYEYNFSSEFVRKHRLILTYRMCMFKCVFRVGVGWGGINLYNVCLITR